MTTKLKVALGRLKREIFASVEFPDVLHRAVLAFPKVAKENMFSTQLWNFQQSILARIGKPPMDCQCECCEPEETFACEGCLKKRAYCFGQDDNFFELCDDCWYEQEGGKECELQLVKVLTTKAHPLSKEFHDPNTIRAWSAAATCRPEER